MSPKKPSRGLLAQARLNNSELELIEALLGEDFESLAQARRALAKETTAIAARQSKQTEQRIKQTTKQLKSLSKSNKKSLRQLEKEANAARKQFEQARAKLGKALEEATKERKQKRAARESKRRKLVSMQPGRPYTLRELSSEAKETIGSFLIDRENAVSLNKVLEPNEYFAAEVPYRYVGADGRIKVGYAKTYNIFKDSSALFFTLSGYTDDNVSELANSRFLNRIKIMTVNNDGTWGVKKRQEISERKSFFVDLYKQKGTYNPQPSKRGKRGKRK